MKYILFFIALAAQAQVNVGVLDQIGTSLPGTCTVGQRYTKTDATAAAVLYVCTATNTWTQQVGTGGGSTTGYGLTDFSYTVSNPTITIAPSAASGAPVPMNCGSSISKLTTPPTVTYSSGGASATGYLYIDCSTGSPVLTFGHNSANTFTSSGVTVTSGISAFPTDKNIFKLWVVPMVSGSWSAVDAANDQRAIYGAGRNVSCSSGCTTTETAGGVSIAVTGGAWATGILSRQGPNSNVTLTGGATYDTIFTYSLPANTLSANGCLRVTLGARNSGTVTYRIGWGTATYDIGGFGAETYGGRAEFIVCNTGATNAQSILFPHVAGLWYAYTSTAGPGFYPLTTATQDTTSAVLITLKANGTASDTVTPVWFLVNQL